MIVSKSDEYHILKFGLPAEKKIYNLRFDPISSWGNFAIKKIGIYDESGEELRQVGLNTLKPLNQIRNLTIENGVLLGQTDLYSNDPILGLDLDYPLEIKTRKYLAKSFGEVFKGFIAIFVLSFTAMLLACSDIENNSMHRNKE